MCVETPVFCREYHRLVFVIVLILLKSLTGLAVESCVIPCVAVALFLTEGVWEKIHVCFVY